MPEVRVNPGSSTSSPRPAIWWAPWESNPAPTDFGAATPRWAHGAPPLWGFLLYDLVLFVPYLRLLGADTGGVDDYYGDGGRAVNRTSLAIYLTVLSVSAALAVYALFVNPATRGRASPQEVV